MTPFQTAISLATEFCKWCDSSPSDSKTEVLRLQSLLLSLYQSLSQLTISRNSDADTIGHINHRVDDQEWKRVFKRCSDLPFQYYWHIHNPHVIEGEDPVLGDLADDVADIYRDLSEVLALNDAGHPLAAQWKLVFSFKSHWGHHASSAIYAIHCWLEEHEPG